MKDKLLKIVNHYGINHQLRKFNEETFELKEVVLKREFIKDNILDDYLNGLTESFGRALIKLLDGKDASKERITEEISDCYVLLEQFKLYYEITDEEVQKIMEEKVERQLKRMEDEK